MGCKFEADGLRFARVEVNSLKAFERTNRDYVVAVLRVSDVELSHFIAGFLAGIGDGGSDGNRLACAGFGGALDL